LAEEVAEDQVEAAEASVAGFAVADVDELVEDAVNVIERNEVELPVDFDIDELVEDVVEDVAEVIETVDVEVELLVEDVLDRVDVAELVALVVEVREALDVDDEVRVPVVDVEELDALVVEVWEVVDVDDTVDETEVE